MTLRRAEPEYSSPLRELVVLPIEVVDVR